MAQASDPAKRYFHERTTDEIRAVFEATISLSMLYHKLIGLPVSDNVEDLRLLEKALELSVKKQPYKTYAFVRIDKERIRNNVREKGKSAYSYVELEGDMLELRVKAEYGEAYAVVGMKYVKELNYPLMYIEEIGTKKKGFKGS
ncbi:MAG: dihydroneopterin aldolase family protein [Conexivisphaerales archaeon]